MRKEFNFFTQESRGIDELKKNLNIGDWIRPSVQSKTVFPKSAPVRFQILKLQVRQEWTTLGEFINFFNFFFQL